MLYSETNAFIALFIISKLDSALCLSFKDETDNK